ncbi:MAG: hypothetical protein WCP85_15290 [Mariniphaga sp.]
MKKIILTTLTVLITVGICFAHDVITKKTGDDIQAKISEITTTQIKFTRFDNLKGPIYSIDKSEVLMIRYENGTKDIFSELNKSTEKATKTDRTNTKMQQGEMTNHKYKNRIGFTIGTGSGFKNIPFAKFTDGTESTISYGDATSAEFEYGYEFNRHFDLTFNIGSQFSEPSQTVDNANLTFNRGVVSLTPAYILPIGAKEKMRLKFGAGIDWLYNAELNIELSKISGGFDDDWKYDSGFGGHLSVIFEYNTPKRFTYCAGLKLQNVNYKFKSGVHSHPTSDELIKPNGAGFVFLMGVYYHFNWIKD